MHQLLQDLLDQGTIITDGAWGTMLQAKGLPSGACPDELNLSNPGIVGEVAAAYVAAGSNIILTNTFGASDIMLKRHELQDQCIEINQAGVEISKEAAGDDALVFASMGPTGVMLMMGEYTPEQVEDSFKRQADALVAGGADALLVESFTDVEEAALAVRAAATTGMPVVASIVFDSGADLDRTMMGQTPEQAAEMLMNAGADIVGSNCGKGIEAFAAVCQRLHDTAQAPVWIKANAGMPEIINGKTVFSQTPAAFASHVPVLVAAGAGFIGGCCGTTPEFIEALCKTLAE